MFLKLFAARLVKHLNIFFQIPDINFKERLDPRDVFCGRGSSQRNTLILFLTNEIF